MTQLGPSEIVARRRPFVVLAIAGLRLVFGCCLAFPLASLIAESGVGLRGASDRVLFEGGGYLLLELLRLHGGALAAAARGLLPLLAFGLLAGAAGNVALLVALDVREKLTSFAWLSRAAARFPSHVVVSAGAGLVKLLVLLVAAMTVGAVPEWLDKPAASTLVQALSLLPFVLLLAAVGGAEDVAKAALVRHDAELGEGLLRALHCGRHRPVRAYFGWVPYAAGLVTAAAAVSWLTERLDVSHPGAWRVASVFVLHQIVVVVSVACRAAWFARALRLVASR